MTSPSSSYPDWGSYIRDLLGHHIRRAESAGSSVHRVSVGPDIGRWVGAPCEVEGKPVMVSVDLPPEGVRMMARVS